jgi:KDO2-lipid IV(A) lauroyltransferase
MTIEQIRDRTHVEGLHHLIEAAGAGRGVVVGSLHSRNWDFTMACIADALARPVDVPCGTFVDRPVLDWVIHDRARHGLHYLPPMDTRGERFEEMRRRIERSGVAIVVTDFSESQVGCEVRLLGGQAFISSGAAALAVATGAPLLSLVSWYDANGRVQAVIGPGIPVEIGVSAEIATSELAQTLADRFSAAIARHPEDWHAALGQANGFDPRAAVISPQRGEVRRAAR